MQGRGQGSRAGSGVLQSSISCDPLNGYAVPKHTQFVCNNARPRWPAGGSVSVSGSIRVVFCEIQKPRKATRAGKTFAIYASSREDTRISRDGGAAPVMNVRYRPRPRRNSPPGPMSHILAACCYFMVCAMRHEPRADGRPPSHFTKSINENNPQASLAQAVHPPPGWRPPVRPARPQWPGGEEILYPVFQPAPQCPPVR